MQISMKEEPSRKEQTRKPWGSPLTSSGFSETLQPFLCCAVRNGQDRFISGRDSDCAL